MKKNPWIGLSSYDEKKLAEGYKFCGRSKAIMELYSLVDNNVFITMYGKSGIGKSSLLCAGLFPKLRANNYFPVYIRLGIDKNTTISYSETIIENIQNEMSAAGCTISTCGSTISAEKEEYLWNYFSCTEFRNANGNIIYPVIVLDQFEELFFGNKQNLMLMLKQMYLLLDDSSVSIGSGVEGVTNFRILLSIREDDFFRLEDVIEDMHLIEMKYNRYRLGELSEDEAKEAILFPADDIIASDNANVIAEKIIAIAKGDDGEISSAMLSLLCSRMYEYCLDKGETQLTRITVERFFKTSAGNFMESFYEDVITQLKDRRKWEYIEDELVTDDGRRNSILKSQFDAYVNNADFLFKGKYAILREVTYQSHKESHVEIIHDMLAKQMKAGRNERHQKAEMQKMRKRQRRNVALVVVILAIAAFFAYQFWTISVKTDEINRGRKNLLITQSRYLASEAYKEFENGNYGKAIRIALYALPKNLEKPERPFVSDLELLIRNSDAAYIYGNVELKKTITLDQEVREFFYSPDGKNILTATSDDVYIYDAENLDLLHRLNSDISSLSGVIYSKDGKYIYIEQYNSVEVWEAQSGKRLDDIKLRDDFSFVCFSVDKRHFLSKDKKTGAIHVYTLQDGSAVLMANIGKIMIENMLPYVNICPNEKYMAAEMSDDKTSIYDFETKRILYKLELNYGENIIFTSDSKSFATTDDGKLKFYDVKNGNTIPEPATCENWDYPSLMTCDGKYITVRGTRRDDRIIYEIYNTNDSTVVASIESNESSLYEPKFSPDGKFIIARSVENNKVNIWEIANEQNSSFPFTYNVYFNKEGSSFALYGSNGIQIWNTQERIPKTDWIKYDGNYKFSFGDKDSLHIVHWNRKDSAVYLVDYVDGKQTREILLHNGLINNADISYNNSTIVLFSDSVIYAYDIGSGEQLLDSLECPGLCAARISIDGEKLMTFNEKDTTITIWNIKDGRQTLKNIKYGNRSSVFYTYDSKNVVKIDESHVYIIDIETGKLLLDISHNAKIKDVACVPDNKHIVVTSEDDLVCVWNLDTGNLVNKIHTGCSSFHICQNCQYLAIRNKAGSTSVYRLFTGKKIIELFSDFVQCFSPDGTNIVIRNYYSSTSTILPFPSSLQELIDKYRNDLEHDWSLTDEEKAEYSLE